MSVIIELWRQSRDAVAETLPQSGADLRPFLAGMAWALVIYVCVLIAVSWLTAKAFGWPL